VFSRRKLKGSIITLSSWEQVKTKKEEAVDTISFAYIVLLDSVTPLLCLALYLFSIWVSKLQVLSDMLWL